MSDFSTPAEDLPLIGSLDNFGVLRKIYSEATSSGFLPGISYLENHYASMRSVKGDGNCFYRAILYGMQIDPTVI